MTLTAIFLLVVRALPFLSVDDLNRGCACQVVEKNIYKFLQLLTHHFQDNLCVYRFCLQTLAVGESFYGLGQL